MHPTTVFFVSALVLAGMSTALPLTRDYTLAARSAGSELDVRASNYRRAYFGDEIMLTARGSTISSPNSNQYEKDKKAAVKKRKDEQKRVEKERKKAEKKQKLPNNVAPLAPFQSANKHEDHHAHYSTGETHSVHSADSTTGLLGGR